jgi:hypothetical protein
MEKLADNIKKNKMNTLTKKLDNKRSLNSRVFLPSSQCMGSKGHYLFAFGGE